ncbi:MAG: MBL fold metallo-hydrolase, partial [Candidatus Cloacimonetes bacterium]|nr:MBL fold metallo-hydrolase [Candidatus Cloacimonadota bacterium]
WQKFLETDEKNRIQFALNLLLIQVEGKNILIDTGIGNKITEKQKKIYNPSDFTLLDNLQEIGLSRFDIDFVVLTHLHFDHAGGIVSLFNDTKKLTFPNALHIFQEKEWEIAKNPDELNKPGYNFTEDLKLLEESGNYQIINGDFVLTPEIKLEFVAGHSEGTQIIRIESNDDLAYYAGDIICFEMHLHPGISTSYDICRKDTTKAKKKILNELREQKGILFLNHDMKKSFIQF